MNTTAGLTDLRVMVIGLGRVGLSLAVRAAEAGYLVQGIDLDRNKIRLLSERGSYVDGVSDEQLRDVMVDGRFRARHAGGLDAEILPFDYVVIAVPTLLSHGKPNLTQLESAARLVGRNLSPGNTVIVGSASYPGTTEGLVANVIFEESGFHPGEDYYLGFSPERFEPGSAVNTFRTTPRLVSGSGVESLKRITAFYDNLVDQTVPVSSPAVAEFARAFENIYSQVNTALVNELAVVAHEFNIDIWEVIEAANTKPYGIHRHAPVPGVGGHGLSIDPAYLAWLVHTDLGMQLRLSEAAQEINDSMPAYVVQRAQNMLSGGLRNARILLLGASTYPGTADMREAPALEIVELLRRKGAHVTISDPHVQGWAATPNLPAESVVSQAAEFSLVIVVTDHDEFDFDKIADTAHLVLDCRRRMTPSATVASL